MIDITGIDCYTAGYWVVEARGMRNKKTKQNAPKRKALGSHKHTHKAKGSGFCNPRAVIHQGVALTDYMDQLQ